MIGFFLILLIIVYGSQWVTAFSFIDGIASIPKALSWLVGNFYPTEKSLQKIPTILTKLVETLLLSIAAATVGAFFALFSAIFGARPTAFSKPLALFSRGLATLFRNIDVAAWSMILLFSFGQSALTGFFALFFASFGFLTRVFMETIDEVGLGAVEALRATGAGYWPIVFQAILPASQPLMISWTLFMIETNIRSAVLVGILTGSGVGFTFDLYYKNMNYNAAGLTIVFIAATILLLDRASNMIRRAIL
ncbi:MAG: Phosphonate ABC transporter permease protein phnE2 [Candidatus Carbobacillus altaicus]|uniref:Phosphonate ABC transporter permease protein phnE2 n=1 Tax=Candidatus Carbonibacillus altaicus TaxID=2163959 RepID=A0A2R6Y299_9BACL|nr:MAG: Phosphonate ABC transporter permease protein phnE2 [Candidatus Carbobacillus altaicus]